MNVEAYRIIFKNLKLDSKMEYQINGRLCMDRVHAMLRDPLINCDPMPIAALLLDYEMPEANGL